MGWGDREMSVTDALDRKSGPNLVRQAPVGEAEIDALMRKFFEPKSLGGGSQMAALTETANAPHVSPRRDFNRAEELLERAAHAFSVLMDRCQILEQDLDNANEQAQAHAAEQIKTIDQWKRLASDLKEQINAADASATALKNRCEAAEARASAAEQKATALEQASMQAAQHAAMAEQLSTKLHDKVVAAFGIGSRAHPVLEAVATRAAAE